MGQFFSASAEDSEGEKKCVLPLSFSGVLRTLCIELKVAECCLAA